MVAPVGHEEIRRTELFSEATVEILDEVIAGSSMGTYGNRQCLYRAGQPADRVFFVLEGEVQIYLRGNRKHAVLSIVGAGEAFALSAVLETGRHMGTAEAVGPCRVLEVPAPVITGLIHRHPAIAEKVIHLFALRLQAMSDHFERIQLMQTTQRLADYLLGLAPDRPGKCEVVLPFEKSLIATYLGMEPESLSRAMKNLRPHGLTCVGRKVCIEDRNALESLFAEGRA